jgi:hypothetical protein
MLRDRLRLGSWGSLSDGLDPLDDRFGSPTDHRFEFPFHCRYRIRIVCDVIGFDVSDQDISIEGIRLTIPGSLILQDMRAEYLLEILLNFLGADFSDKPEEDFAER